MWIICSLILLTLLIIADGNQEIHERQRRYLVFTKDTQWGVFATISIPLHPETTVSVAWFFEANYYNVDNATYLDPLLGDISISRNKKERSVNTPYGFTRSFLYSSIETMLLKHGYPGRPCLLRVICENATSHLLHNGLLGDLLHFVFTPSTSISEDTLEDIYYEAEYYGLEDECDHYTYNCPSSPLESITLNIEDFMSR